jgi:hypothetical protein
MNTNKRKNGDAAEKYAEFINKHVIIYYQDMSGTDRRLHGVITEVRGDVMYLQNGEWSGVLDCAHATVSLVSTVSGWGKDKDLEYKADRGIIGKLFGK